MPRRSSPSRAPSTTVRLRVSDGAPQPAPRAVGLLVRRAAPSAPRSSHEHNIVPRSERCDAMRCDAMFHATKHRPHYETSSAPRREAKRRARRKAKRRREAKRRAPARSDATRPARSEATRPGAKRSEATRPGAKRRAGAKRSAGATRPARRAHAPSRPGTASRGSYAGGSRMRRASPPHPRLGPPGPHALQARRSRRARASRPFRARSGACLGRESAGATRAKRSVDTRTRGQGMHQTS